MDIRELLTDKDIEDIKQRVVNRILEAEFLDTIIEKDKDGGGTYTYHQLKFALDASVKKHIDDILLAYIERVADETIRPKVAEAADIIATRLAEQVKTIADKINWYWSLK